LKKLVGTTFFSILALFFFFYTESLRFAMVTVMKVVPVV